MGVMKKLNEVASEVWISFICLSIWSRQDKIYTAPGSWA
jgi:hypothetical protein